MSESVLCSLLSGEVRRGPVWLQASQSVCASDCLEKRRVLLVLLLVKGQWSVMLCCTLWRILLLCWLHCAEGLVSCEVVSCTSSGVTNYMCYTVGVITNNPSVSHRVIHVIISFCRQ